MFSVDKAAAGRMTRVLLPVGVASVAMFVALLFFGTVDLPAGDVWQVLTGGFPANPDASLIVVD
ncbi:MAG: hypothetical protein K2I61_03330, partial [Muribaculaceae bacterium]|nr:hypothetical protein [Muribaculaceae bacterium]